MKRWIFLLAAGLLLGHEGRADRPNIVLIMSDDMGYSDLGCFGGEIDTPSLDSLAAGGLRFSRFYSQNMCVVSRACLLTGVYHTTSVRQKAISPLCPTIAECLREAGYFTAMAGKWHLARYEDEATWPNQRGFQRFYGTLGGAGSFFAPSNLIRDNKDASDEFETDRDYYYTDAISDNAVNYIREAKDDQPLFLYVAYTAAHWPLHAKPADIAKYRGKYSKGWDALRKERFARMKELGVIRKDTELSPRNPEVPAWQDEEHPEWQERRMEVYAAQVEVMDRGIGRIIDTLKKTGRFENTLILFMIDNGGCHVEYGPNRKGDYLPDTTRDGRPMRPGNLPSIMPGPEDTYQSYGYGWANLSNTPFRLFKQHDHEGGIHTPLIAHWPKGVPSRGSVTYQIGHLIDVMPTALELAGAKRPKTTSAGKSHPLDGQSLLPVFEGRERDEPKTHFFANAQGQAVRQGEWKLVRVRAGKKKSSNWELYNLREDPTELRDLADKNPGRVGTLTKLFENWLARSSKRP
ncbi:MAG: arylsulfatase [Verrucomicrobiae bacterium]|nr:arylsulfatase [Verrucomicrobiae bacterium]